jgi:uncharacterized membrane protein
MQESKPATSGTTQIHRALSLVVAAMFVVVLYEMATDLTAIERSNWELQLLIVLAALNSLTAMARQLAWQYVLSATAFTAALGTAAHAVSENSGIPFGPFVFGPNAGEKVMRISCLIPFLWVVVLFNSRGVSRLILRPWRKMKTYGFWLIGITVGLSTIFDWGMDPFLARLNRYWLWQPTKLPVTWQGAPLLNFLGWMLVSLLILAFATPLLIKKKPGEKSAVDYHPLVVWVGAMALFAVTCGRHGFWWPAGVDVAAIVAASVMAIRGAKW